MRIGYWHFVFLSPESQTAAEASECAGDQEAFWEYHDLIFEKQTQGVSLSAENLKQFASDLGLDQNLFDSCLDSGKHTEWVKQQTSIARQIGVQSTPTFLINAQPIIGAQPFENFQQVIEGQLAK